MTGDDGYTPDIWYHITQEKIIKYTLPETNLAPEHRPSQKTTGISTINFQGRTAVRFSKCFFPLSPKTHPKNQGLDRILDIYPSGN